MSDEQQEQGGTSIKSIVIGLLSTITLGVGGFITNKLTGGDEEAKTEVAAPAPVINITNSNQQQQQQSAGKTIIIKEKATPSQQTQQPAKPVVSKKEKEEEDAQW